MTTTKRAIKLKKTKANQSYEKLYDPQLRDIYKIPIEKLISLSNEDLAILIRELDKIITEAQDLKNWITGIIDLKNSMNGKSSCNGNDIHSDKNNNSNILGGINEQITDY